MRDLEQALSDVRELERQRAELWQQAAHDLRGNLGVVSNVAQGLTFRDLPADKRQDFLLLLRNNVRALHHLLARIFHVVAQVVEAELVVGAVGDVGGVGVAPLQVVQPVHDHADGEAEEGVEPAHPLGVAPGEVVVHGHDVHAAPRQRVEVNRQRGDQRLALARLHLGDLAVVQHHAADQLHVEVPQPQHPARRLPHGRERLRQQRVKRLAGRQATAELGGLALQRLVGERLHGRLQRVDRRHPALERLDAAVVGGAEDGAGDASEHGGPSRVPHPCSGGRCGDRIRAPRGQRGRGVGGAAVARGRSETTAPSARSAPPATSPLIPGGALIPRRSQGGVKPAAVQHEFVRARRSLTQPAQPAAARIDGAVVRTPDGALFSNPLSLDVMPAPAPPFTYVGLIGRGPSNDTAVLKERNGELRSVRRDDVVAAASQVDAVLTTPAA